VWQADDLAPTIEQLYRPADAALLTHDTGGAIDRSVPGHHRTLTPSPFGRAGPADVPETQSAAPDPWRPARRGHPTPEFTSTRR
ncbi:hypothetical protein ACFXOQ_37515, partial [Streptomyces californicus]|uniref:hypothetical protein n=1 Tax=Streptomyces californicus TaxID=67351 RepID=UPI0036A10EA7